MEAITVRELLEAVNGTCWGPMPTWTGPWTGWIRTAAPSMRGFVHSPGGERFDGHAYINSALEGGAAAASLPGSAPATRKENFILR